MARMGMYDFLLIIQTFPDLDRRLDEFTNRGLCEKQITSKAQRASDKGLMDYGVTARSGWLTEAGEQYLKRGGMSHRGPNWFTKMGMTAEQLRRGLAFPPEQLHLGGDWFAPHPNCDDHFDLDKP